MTATMALLRERPRFRALWSALALSSIGSGAALTALTLYVEETRGTGTAVAALMIAELGPRLLGPLAGSLADRVDLRRLMIGADLGQAVVYVALAQLPPFAAILGLGALTSILQTTYSPARAVAVPTLVEEDELLRANSLVSVAFNLYVAVGPLVGGILFALGGAETVMLINAATFLISALLTRTIPSLPPRGEDAAGESLLESTRTGMRFALADPLSRAVVLTIFGICLFVSVDNVALVFLVRDTLGGSGAAYGFVCAAFGAGMMLGSLGVMRSLRWPPAHIYLVGLGLSAAGTLLTGLAPAILVAALVQLVYGSGNGVEIAASDTVLQQGVPRELLGRVFGLTWTAYAAGAAIAMVAGGFLVDATSPRVAFVVAGCGALAVVATAAPFLLRAQPT